MECLMFKMSTPEGKKIFKQWHGKYSPLSVCVMAAYRAWRVYFEGADGEDGQGKIGVLLGRVCWEDGKTVLCGGVGLAGLCCAETPSRTS